MRRSLRAPDTVELVTPLPRSLLPDATALLAAAFDEDPFFRFLAPAAEKRRHLLDGVMSSFLALAVPRDMAGAVLTDASELRGLSLWYPPNAYPPPAAEMARAYTAAIGPNLVRRRLGTSMITLALRMAHLLEEAQLPGPHFYLQVLGVDPRWHGRGTGSAMLRERIAEADEAQLPASLETSKEMNVRLYRRFGFEIVRTTRVESSPPVWTMVREPRPVPSPLVS